jgi:NO-binding membrane sensor protein with MHYT domain
MTGSESQPQLDWRAAFSVICLIAGIGLIVAPVFLPKRVLNKGSWSQAQAEKYQAASIKLHGLSMASVHPSPDANPEALHKELKQAEQEYAAIRAQLDSALARPSKIIWILRGLGVALLVAGGFAAKSLRGAS